MTTATIFVSSVQKELAEERRAIKAYIEGDPLLRRFFTVFLFEDLPASDRRADMSYLDHVDRATIYLGLFGNDYGSPDAAGISPTEREFDRASVRAKQRLVFVKGSEDRARDPRMLALIRRAGEQLIRRRFQATTDLIGSLYASLVDHLDRTGKLATKPFDAAACPDATIDDLSIEKLDTFLSRAHLLRGYPLEPGTPVEKALAHLNLLDGGVPSRAAVLLFARQPQRFLLTSEVKCLHFHGTDVQKPIPSYHVYKGTVFELVDQAVDFVMSKIARRVGTRALGPQAPVSYELPREVVAEAIVNAITHRDYASNASVQVMLFADRLEVWNPGELPASLTLAELERPHPSIPRNPLIAEPMFLARYAEKAGTGILDMIGRCLAGGLEAPKFAQRSGQFVQSLARPVAATTAQVAEQVTTQVTPVLRLVRALRSTMTQRELQQALNLKSREHFRKSFLQPALAQGLIEPTVADKPRSRLQRYRLTAMGSLAAGMTTEVATEVATEVTTEVDPALRLIKAIRGSMTRRELQLALQLKNDEHFRKAYLQPALDQGLLEPTIPDKPRSRLQRYRLTPKGVARRGQTP